MGNETKESNFDIRIASPNASVDDLRKQVRDEKRQREEEFSRRGNVYHAEESEKPKAQKETPKKEEDKKEFDPKTAEWDELWMKVKQEQDGAKAKVLMEEMKQRIKEAEKAGLIDFGWTRDVLTTALQESDWDNFYRNLKLAGDKLERDSDKITKYKNDPKYNGMLESVSVLLANQISSEQLTKTKKTKDTARKNWSDEQWVSVGEKMAPGTKFDNVKDIQDLYYKRRQSSSADFASLLRLDVEVLSKLITEPSPSKKKQDEELKKLRTATATATSSGNRGEYSQVSQIPRGVGAAFDRSIAENMAKQTGLPENHIVNVYELVNETGNGVNEDQIDKWVADNMYAFNRIAGDSVAGQANAHLGFYTGQDLAAAFRAFERSHVFEKDGVTRLTGEALAKAERDIEKVRAGVDRAEKKMIRAIALHGLVRDIEASDGSGTKVMGFQLGEDRGQPITDNVTPRKESLLMENTNYYLDLFAQYTKEDVEKNLKKPEGLRNPKIKEGEYKNPEVMKVYKELLNQMGIGVDTRKGDMIEMHKEPVRDKLGRIKTDENGDRVMRLVRSKVLAVDIDHFVGSELFKHIYKGGGGFNGWIEEKLKEEDQDDDRRVKSGEPRPERKSHQERWVDMKTACDMIMADGKFTQWSAKLPETIKAMDERGKVVEKKRYNLCPSKNWGGDPMGGLRKPSNLPQDVKGVYRTENGKKVMSKYDLSFRPSDILADADDYIPVSLVGAGTKKVTRHMQAMYEAIKNSRAGGLGDFGKDGAASLDTILELLDQATANNEGYLLKDGRTISDKEFTCLMMIRLLECKALAATLDSPPPTLLKGIMLDNLLKRPETKFMPNAEALTTLLGTGLDGKSGFVAKMMGDRTNLVMNKEAQETLHEAVTLLLTNNQDEGMRKLAWWFNLLGFLLNASFTVTETTMAVAGGPSFGGGGGKK